MDAGSEKEETCGRAEREKREFHPGTPFEFVVVLATSRILHAKEKLRRGKFRESREVGFRNRSARTLFPASRTRSRRMNDRALIRGLGGYFAGNLGILLFR